jgi:large subunit ribosomal protein L15
VICRYYNRLSLYDCVKGRTDRIDAAPTRREDIGMCFFSIDLQCVLRCFLFSLERYTNWKNRGYLAPESIAKMPIVQERWRQLSEQLTRFRDEEFAKAKR